MNKTPWIIASILIFLGILCLFMVGSGATVRPMGSMMGPMMMFGMLWMIAFLFLAVLLLVFFYLQMKKWRERENSCRSCGQRLHREWKVCPYCGERIEKFPDR